MSIVRGSIALGALLIALGTQVQAADKATEKPSAKSPGAAASKPAAKPAAKSGGGFVAKVNGVGISQTEFDRNWEYFLRSSGIPASHADKTGSTSEFRKTVLDNLVTEELLYQEAKSRKLLVAKEEVDAEIEKARAQYPTPEAFKEALTQAKLSEESLRSFFSRSMSIKAFVTKELFKDVTVSDAEVHDFYAGNKEKFEAPEQARARHILVAVDEKADEKVRQEAKAKAEAILAALKGGGGSFEEAAKQSADVSSKDNGGDIGFFRQGQTVPEFEKAAFALKPGELSGVVQTKYGYHIIRLEELKPAGLVPEAEVAPRIKEHLTELKTDAVLEQQVKALREKAKIEVLMKL